MILCAWMENGRGVEETGQRAYQNVGHSLCSAQQRYQQYQATVCARARERERAHVCVRTRARVCMCVCVCVFVVVGVVSEGVSVLDY